MINVKKELEKTARNSIRLAFGGKTKRHPGASKFGGVPDVPEGFEWPYFESMGYNDDEPKNRPLSFFAQFDLADISRFDTEGLLPKSGVLSFFYDYETTPWGFDPKDKGCARVFFFENANEIYPAEFPKDLSEDNRFPELAITARSEKSYQCFEDFMVQRDPRTTLYEEYETAEEKLGLEFVSRSKLLGWADIIQGNMTRECELVSRGYYLGSGWDDVKPRDRQEAEQWANRDWLLLLQIDCCLDEDNDEFELSLGDGGIIYFYIRREDLAAKNFDKVWLILQCG